jgi:hypothetical protein
MRTFAEIMAEDEALTADMAIIRNLSQEKLDRLTRLYPALCQQNGTVLQAARFDKMRNRRDDLAMIALGAAEFLQEYESHRKVTLEAWNDAINGGIVVC